MSAVIRLQPGGRKKQAYYKIVVTDKRKKLTGASRAQVGTYNPMLSGPNNFTLDLPLIQSWIKLGAIPSDTVKEIINKAKRKEAELLAASTGVASDKTKMTTKTATPKADAAKADKTAKPKADAAAKTDKTAKPKADAAKADKTAKPKADAAKADKTAKPKADAAKADKTAKPKADAAKADKKTDK